MTGINASKIIQNLEFVHSFGLSSLAFFLFWFFHFAIWVQCKPVGPRRENGADGVGVFIFEEIIYVFSATGSGAHPRPPLGGRGDGIGVACCFPQMGPNPPIPTSRTRAC